MDRLHSSIALLSCVAALTAAGQKSTPSLPSFTIRLSVDARDAPQEIIHAHLQIPVSPGNQTVVCPKWIPGEHGPTGPIANLTGLTIHGGGRLLSWQRDDVDMYAFHIHVPERTTLLDVTLDFHGTGNTAARWV